MTETNKTEALKSRKWLRSLILLTILVAWDCPVNSISVGRALPYAMSLNFFEI